MQLFTRPCGAQVTHASSSRVLSSPCSRTSSSSTWISKAVAPLGVKKLSKASPDAMGIWNSKWSCKMQPTSAQPATGVKKCDDLGGDQGSLGWQCLMWFHDESMYMIPLKIVAVSKDWMLKWENVCYSCLCHSLVNRCTFARSPSQCHRFCFRQKPYEKALHILEDLAATSVFHGTTRVTGATPIYPICWFTNLYIYKTTSVELICLTVLERKSR